MTGFDPRTGEEIWRQSMGCANTTYTPTQIVCLNVFGDHVRAALVDSATGTRTAESRATIPEAGRPETWAFLSNPVVASGAGVVMAFGSPPAPSPRFRPRSFTSTPPRAHRCPSETTSPWSFWGDARGDLLVSTLRDDGDTTVALDDPDGTRRRTFSPHAAPSGGESDATARLYEQIISVVDRGTELVPEQSLAVFDRDCRELVALPLPADTDITGIVPAARATTVVRSDDNGTHIDGYSPTSREWPCTAEALSWEAVLPPGSSCRSCHLQIPTS
jgi:hypothetical protein